LSTLASLLSTALVISLVGFMEAISIAKAIAARTRQRLDPNQELVGQGLANLAGSFTQCFPASGSFSRSAVNLQAGARTGLSSAVAAAIVVLTLQFLTPLLYHLPQAVLAAVIMLAVVSLIQFDGIRHAWRAQRHDGMAGALAFVASLALAPHLDLGILIGAGVSVLLFLYRTMRPRIAVLGRHPDGTLRDAAIHALPLSEHLVALRFDGQLYFANVPHFEDSLLDVSARFPKARHILVVADGINQIDASGDEVIRHLVERLRDNGVVLAFSGLKKQVRDVLDATGTLRAIGDGNLFVHEDQALSALADRVSDPAFDRAAFPLLA
jgi:SulP family sulfate permease